MRVLHVCTELYPLLKTGGLADVAGALPPAQRALGADARVLLPGFPALMAGVRDLQPVAQLPACFGVAGVRLLCGQLPDAGVTAYVIDVPELYDRSGNPYSDAEHREYPDNYKRFALLGWMAAQLAQGLDSAWTPDVLHCHDWHAGLAPAYLRAAREGSGRTLAASVITVHNLAYQGVFPRSVFAELGLPPEYFGVNGVEFHGQVSFLKAGLYYADRITTVSPTYAREICGPEQGCGLDGLLRTRAGDLSGVLNGVDDTVWNPAVDNLIPAHYASADLAGKAACKLALQRSAGLAEDANALVFCVVSRLTEQKGLHLVLAALPELVRRGGQLVLLGSGEPGLEAAFRDAALAQPQSVAVRIGYDEQYAHRIVAGSDVIMVPSRFEPCGLTQLYGLKYCTLPLVRRVGGLADTVRDCSLENLADDSATGFVFDAFTVDGISAALRRAFALRASAVQWRQVEACAMRQDFGWEGPAADYLALYQHIAP